MAAKLTKAQVEVLRLCDSPLGFVAGDMSGPEKRTAQRLGALGLLDIATGERAFVTDAGRSALSQHQGGGRG